MTIDLRERYENIEEIIRSAIEARQNEIYTGLPGFVEEWDGGETMKVRLAIKGYKKNEKGEVEAVEIPVLEDVPIGFPSAGGKKRFTTTYPLKKGDPVFVTFSSRPLDTWYQSGKVDQQIDARTHHLSDAVAHPGFQPKPRALKNVSKDSTQLRVDVDEGKDEKNPEWKLKHFVDLHDENGITHSVEEGKHVTKIHPKDGIKYSVNKDQHVMIIHPENGFNYKSDKSAVFDVPDIKSKGEIVGDYDGKQIKLTSHIHKGVTPGTLFTQDPQEDT
jgi:hypothetical protein